MLDSGKKKQSKHCLNYKELNSLALLHKQLGHCRTVPPYPLPHFPVVYDHFFFSQFKVTENSHRYLKEIEMREEAGTPAIVGAIRAGLVFQLKQVQDKY